MTASIRVTSADGKVHEVALGHAQRIAIKPGDRVEVPEGAEVAQVTREDADLVLLFAGGERLALGGFAEAVAASSLTTLALPEAASPLTPIAGLELVPVADVAASAWQPAPLAGPAALPIDLPAIGGAVDAPALAGAPPEAREILSAPAVGGSYSLLLSKGPSIDAISDDGGLSDSDFITQAAVQDLRGTAAPLAEVHIKLDSTQVGVAYADDTGAWTFTDLPTLSEGPNTVRATAYDGDLNPLGSATEVITVDNDDPDAPLATAIALDVDSDSGTAGDDKTNVETGPVFVGVVEPFAEVEVTVDGSTDWATADETGHWTLTGPELGSGDGTYTVAVTVTDLAGNTGGTGEYSFELDTDAPGMPTVIGFGPDTGFVDADGYTSATELEITGEADPDALVEIWSGDDLLGSAMSDGTWSSALYLSERDDATYTVTITATDDADNESDATEFTFTVDTAAPDAPMAIGLAAGEDSGELGDQLTNSLEPAFTGEAEPSTVVSLVLDEGGTVTAMADEFGLWTIAEGMFTDAGAADDGLHTVSVWATDDAGNEGDASTFDFTLDTQAPDEPGFTGFTDTGLSATDALTNDATPIFTGTAEADSLVELWNVSDDSLLGTALADGEGFWEITSTALGDGDGAYTVSVTATDAADNMSTGTTFSFELDTDAPGAPTVIDFDVDSGFDTADGLTNDTTPLPYGEAEPGSLVTVYDDDMNVLGTAMADDVTGLFTVVDFGSALEGEGQHALSVQVTDEAGNTSMTTPLELTLDTIDPATPTGLSLTLNSDLGYDRTDEITAVASPTLEGHAEPNSAVVVTLDGWTDLGPVTADDAGRWTVSLGTPGDGTHTVVAIATDDAGNESEVSAVTTLTIDSDPPAAPTVTGLAGDDDTGWDDSDEYTSVAAPTLMGEREADTRIFVSIDDDDFTVPFGSGEFSVTLPTLADGLHTVSVTAVDAAGNASPATLLPITIDTVAPDDAVVTMFDVDTGADTFDRLTADDTPMFAGAAEAGAYVEITNAETGAYLGSAEVDMDGLWTVDFLEPLPEDGTYTVSISVEDVAGQLSTVTEVFTLDTEDPTPTVFGLDAESDTGYTNDALTQVLEPTIVGEGEAASEVSVSLDDGTAITATVGPDGLWTVSFEGAFTSTGADDGLHTVTAWAIDDAGNLATAADFEFTLDTQAPSDLTLTTSTDGLTNDTTPLFEGTSDAEAVLVVEGELAFDDAGDLLNPVLDFDFVDGGLWALEPELVGDGLHTVTIVATDEAENHISTTVVIDLDTTAPAASVIGLTAEADSGAAGDQLTNSLEPAFTGEAEPSTVVSLVLDEGGTVTAMADEFGLWTIAEGMFTDAGAADDGLHTVSVWATDDAGNESDASTFDFTLDTQAPEATIAIASADQGLYTAIANVSLPSFVGPGGDGDVVVVTVDGIDLDAVEVTGAWTIGVSEDLVDGTHTVSVAVTDAAGNTGESADFVFDAVTTVMAPTEEAFTFVEDNGAGDAQLSIDSDAETCSITIVTSDGEQVEIVGTPDGSGGFDFVIDAAYVDTTVTVFSMEVDEANNLILGAPQTVTLGGSSTYRLVDDADLGGGLVGAEALTLDYSFLASQQPGFMPAEGHLAVGLHEVLDLTGPAAALALAGLSQGAAPEPGTLAMPEAIGNDGVLDQAGRRSAETLANPPAGDFGFGADGMATPDNPYQYMLEQGAWSQA